MVARRISNGHARAPVRVFVGTSDGDDAEACVVLEHTLRRQSSTPIELTWLSPSSDPDSSCGGWLTANWATPWTAYRWAVPELAGWEGRAVYMDCPQVILGDVAALAAAPMLPRAVALVRRSGGGIRTNVLVWDCAKARSLLSPLSALKTEVGAHQRLSAELAGGSPLAGDLPAGWGLQDVEYSDSPARATGSVHYANAHLQPHQALARRRLEAQGKKHWFTGIRFDHFSPGLVQLFETEYVGALASGYSVDAYVARGKVKAASELRA